MQPSSFASALSTNPTISGVVEEICAQLHQFSTARPDLLTVFFSPDFLEQADEISEALRSRLQPRCLMGCCGESIIGTGREIEQRPAISVLAGSLPGSTMTPMHLQFERSADGNAIVGWPEEFDSVLALDSAAATSSLILLADPFSFPTDVLLERINEDWPHVRISGGVASGCPAPGDARILLNERVHTEGAVAIHMSGQPKQSTIVSQGCRPIGQPLVITQAEQNEICQLGGRPALLQLKEIFDRLPTSDQQKVQSGLHIGRVVNEYQDDFEQGDFLIRNVMGIDPQSGRIAVGDYFRAGQTVQFQIRDEASADAEMAQLLVAKKKDNAMVPAAGLLFSCNGRGTRMFSVDHHDAGLIQQKLGEIPLAGFFAAGEIGPVGGKNYLHGFTASLLLFQNPTGS